jgi:hypothetical protein
MRTGVFAALFVVSCLDAHPSGCVAGVCGIFTAAIDRLPILWIRTKVAAHAAT